MAVNRSALLSLLEKSVVKIDYTKSDGSARTVRATLDPTLAPETVQNSSSVVTVWDLDKQAYRSLATTRIGSYMAE